MATYVTITREDFENWLSKLPFPWVRKPNTQGVYWVTLSPTVAIEVHSSLTGRDDTVGYADASMKVSLVSTVTRQTLNRKDMGQSHFKRTTGWRDSLRKGVDRMVDAYNRSSSFYDELAKIADREAYQREWLERIERLPGWQQDNLLASFHERVQGGGILTTKQREVIERQSQRPSRTVDEAMLSRLRVLWVYLRGRPREQAIVQSIAEQVKAGRTLTGPQLGLIQKLEQ